MLLTCVMRPNRMMALAPWPMGPRMTQMLLAAAGGGMPWNMRRHRYTAIMHAAATDGVIMTSLDEHAGVDPYIRHVCAFGLRHEHTKRGNKAMEHTYR
jgi:hypothetical protein